MGRVVPGNLFWPRINWGIYKQKAFYQNYAIWQRSGNLSRRHFLFNCRWVAWIITSIVHDDRGRCKSPWIWHEETKRRNLVRQRPPKFCRIFSKQAGPFLIPSWDFAANCLFDTASSNTLTPTAISPSPLVVFRTARVLFFSSSGSSRSSDPSRKVCFRIST